MSAANPKAQKPPVIKDEKGRFLTGNIGGGRPKGSRNKLGEQFLSAMQADFERNGVAAIEQVRIERPHEYLKVIASILPKELNIKSEPLEEMDEDELAAIVAAARAAIVAAEEGGVRAH